MNRTRMPLKLRSQRARESLGVFRDLITRACLSPFSFLYHEAVPTKVSLSSQNVRMSPCGLWFLPVGMKVSKILFLNRSRTRRVKNFHVQYDSQDTAVVFTIARV